MDITTLIQGITLKDLKPPKRKDIVKMFVDKLNAQIEEENKYAKVQRKLLQPSFVAFKMSHLKVNELWFFLDECKESKNFSSHWWWALKATSVQTPYNFTKKYA